VKVENATTVTLQTPNAAAVPAAAASAASAPTEPPRPVWSFNLVSVEPVATASTPGSKP